MFPRALTDAERALTQQLLERAGIDDREALMQQLLVARVVAECECGCPSVDLSVDPDQAEPIEGSHRPIATADYDGGGVMLWVEDGWLTHLELYWWTDDPPSDFPDLGELSDYRPG